MTEAPIRREQLIGLEDGRIHLCSGSDSPLPQTVSGAMAEHISQRAGGAASRAGFEAMLEDLRARMARLLGDAAHPERVAFVSSAGHAIDTLARLVGWRAGDAILTLDDEFPAVLMAWSGARGQGATLHAVGGGQDPEEALLSAVDEHTRVVCVSHVSYLTGRRLDIPKLSEALRPRGILLVVDASHSLGVIAVPTEHCDAVVSCGHKFLMGMHGTGILYLRDDGVRQAAKGPPLGWYSVASWRPTTSWPEVTLKPGARSLEIGNPAFPTMIALSEGLRLLESAGHQRVEHHALQLAARFRSEIVARGLPCMTPSDPDRHGSSIAIPYPRGERLHELLSVQRILTTNKGGRLRVSFHGFNTTSDLDAVLGVIDAHQV